MTTKRLFWFVFAWCLMQPVFGQKTKSKTTELTANAVMHGKIDKATKEWINEPATILWHIYPYDPDLDRYDPHYQSRVVELMKHDTIVVLPSNVEKTVLEPYGEGYMLTDCVISFAPQLNKYAFETKGVKFRFEGMAFSSLSNLPVEPKPGSDAKMCLCKMVLLEGTLSFDYLVKEEESPVAIYRDIEIKKIKRDHPFVIETSSGPYYVGMKRTFPDSKEFYLSAEEYKSMFYKSGRAISFGDIHLQPYAVTDSLGINSDIHVVFNQPIYDHMLSETFGQRIDRRDYEKLPGNGLKYVFQKMVDFEKDMLEINAETYFIDVSKHMIYRNDGNCFGNSMVKLVADDGRYYEEKNGMVTYYDGKGTKYVGTGASLTFDDWLKSNLPDFSNQFNNAKMYSESGEVIETIEYGRTTAEKRKAEQEEKARQEKGLAEMYKRFGKEWTEHVVNGGAPKVGMPEELLKAYLPTLTGETRYARFYRVWKSSNIYYDITVREGRVTAVFYKDLRF